MSICRIRIIDPDPVYTHGVDIIKKKMENKTVRLLQIGEYFRKKDEKGDKKFKIGDAPK
jgi:hypothetical protein